eukprot:SM000002S05584  [mRNA]  locus=s2:1015449:1019679:+ [translate_table: standard]
MAFGTRGDVQPLAQPPGVLDHAQVLARAMAVSCADVDVHFCSNAAHKVTYKDALEDEGVATTWVSTPPVASRELGSPPNSTGNDVINNSIAGGWGLELEKLHQEQCKDCFDKALGQCEPGDLTLVVFNLFALDFVTELPVSYSWPAAPLLLYGVSPIVVERPEYWPTSVHLCGFWSDKEHIFDTKRSYDGRRHHYVPPPMLQQYLEGSRAGNDPPIVVGFSSMGSMGLIQNAGLLLQILVATIRRTGHRAILLTSNHTPLEDAIAAMAVRPSDKSCRNMPVQLEEGLQLVDGQLFCIAGSIPHDWLFQRCGLVVHHAGSGTTAAALGAGISQVPCPFIFDQFYWAERMAWLGVASKSVALHNILSGKATLEPLVEGTDALTGAILQAAAPTVRQRARDIASNLGKEDGVGAAVSLLRLGHSWC